MLETVTHDTFAPHVGSTFRIVVDDALTLESELEEVETDARRAEAARAAGQREPFSLVFRGPTEPLLAQRIYAFEHDELGRFEIFIVPIGRDESGTSYEATFA